VVNLKRVGVVSVGVEGTRGRGECSEARREGTPGETQEERTGEGEETVVIAPVI